jgi:hypothetical protein
MVADKARFPVWGKPCGIVLDFDPIVPSLSVWCCPQEKVGEIHLNANRNKFLYRHKLPSECGEEMGSLTCAHA